MMTFPLTLMDL